ncbi:MAG TPA: acyl-CoA dehydrogenase family protein [Acidimicrobiales bacterium]|jgi:alkylation response protein AidB-like acyl-CoA dehydrogenase|nr:acyl-CoA dehydrogenase family protein [Acidimicrobiales bacterium]
MTDTAQINTTDQVIDELREWLSSSWDPDLTVAAWWERLGLAGWSAPTLPPNAYGRGLSRNDGVRVSEEIDRFGALGAPAGLGLLLAAPTIATHGTQEQIDTFVRDIVTGQKSWCQLFSEPAAGSDLAGLQTRAVRDGDEWIVNGQKVWTSGGQHANLGMLLARTDPDVPKHQGITYFALEMIQPGVEIRPLKEMTGRALFNEVFMTDARVANDALIGGENNGWAVANTTLANERAGLGSGGGTGAGGAVLPGTVGGGLDRRAGDFGSGQSANGSNGKRKSGLKETDSDAGDAAMVRALSGGTKLLVDLAKSNGSATDAQVRQGLAQLYTWGELGRFNGLRLKAVKATGGDIPGMPNISKLSMSNIMRLSRDLGLQISGAAGMLHGYNAKDRAALEAATGNTLVGFVTEMAMFAQAPSIYGGTDQIQRNILGERVLGLPKEPNNDRTTPFAELPKNV